MCACASDLTQSKYVTVRRRCIMHACNPRYTACMICYVGLLQTKQTIQKPPTRQCWFQLSLINYLATYRSTQKALHNVYGTHTHTFWYFCVDPPAPIHRAWPIISYRNLRTTGSVIVYWSTTEVRRIIRQRWTTRRDTRSHLCHNNVLRTSPVEKVISNRDEVIFRQYCQLHVSYLLIYTPS